MQYFNLDCVTVQRACKQDLVVQTLNWTTFWSQSISRPVATFTTIMSKWWESWAAHFNDPVMILLTEKKIILKVAEKEG